MLYAVVCHPRTYAGRLRLDTWPHELAIGQPLPTVPLFLSKSTYVPLELERTSDATLRGLRIA